MDATATRSSSTRSLEHQYQPSTTTTTASAIVQDTVATVLRDAGITLKALIPLVGAIGNMDAAQLATDCACMLGSFAQAATLGSARGALVQRIASPPLTAPLNEVAAPFGLCLACHEPLRPPGKKHQEMMAQGL